MKNLFVSYLGCTLLCTVFLAHSVAGTPKVYHHPKSKFPVCIQGEKDVLLLSWNTRFHGRRDIVGVLGTELWKDSAPKTCRNWKRASSKFETISKNNNIIEPGTLNFKGFNLEFDSGETLSKLEQIRSGANTAHIFTNGQDYFRSHPEEKYNLEQNRDLAKKYGLRFSAEVYAAKIRSKMLNSEAERRLASELTVLLEETSSGFSEEKAALSRRALRKKFEEDQLHVVLVPGFGGFDGYKNFHSSLRLILGDQLLHVPKVKPYGDIFHNSILIRHTIGELFSKGNKVLLIGISKGVAESLIALSHYAQQVDQEGPKSQKVLDRLVGFVNLSGLVFGSFTADWVVNEAWNGALWNVGKGIVSLLLDLGIKLDGQNPSLPTQGNWRAMRRVLPRLAPKSLTQLYRTRAWIQNNRVALPQSIRYWNFPILRTKENGDFGAHDKSRKLQRMLFDTLPPTYGANDGLIEFPRSQIPSTWASDITTIPLEGSHTIDFAEINLATGSSRAGEPSYFNLDFSHDVLKASTLTTEKEKGSNMDLFGTALLKYLHSSLSDKL